MWQYRLRDGKDLSDQDLRTKQAEWCEHVNTTSEVHYQKNSSATETLWRQASKRNVGTAGGSRNRCAQGVSHLLSKRGVTQDPSSKPGDLPHADEIWPMGGAPTLKEQAQACPNAFKPDSSSDGYPWMKGADPTPRSSNFPTDEPCRTRSTQHHQPFLEHRDDHSPLTNK